MFVLTQAELEYEELKASFDAQNTKHEILKVSKILFQHVIDSLNSFKAKYWPSNVIAEKY